MNVIPTRRGILLFAAGLPFALLPALLDAPAAPLWLLVSALALFAFGADLLLCINPLVPFDAPSAHRRGRLTHRKLDRGGLPLVLSQTFRAIIHSRMKVGMEKYATQYPHADILLFEPAHEDVDMFFARIFSYAQRRRLCALAFESTRTYLRRNAALVEPRLARHGLAHRDLQAGLFGMPAQVLGGETEVDVAVGRDHALVFVLAQAGGHQAAAAAQHPGRFGDGQPGLGGVGERMHQQHQVEAGIGLRQSLHVALGDLDMTVLLQAFAGGQLAFGMLGVDPLLPAPQAGRGPALFHFGDIG